MAALLPLLLLLRLRAAAGASACPPASGAIAAYPGHCVGTPGGGKDCAEHPPAHGCGSLGVSEAHFPKTGSGQKRLFTRSFPYYAIL